MTEERFDGPPIKMRRGENKIFQRDKTRRLRTMRRESNYAREIGEAFGVDLHAR